MPMIADIVARLEKASGADREIDARIAYAATPALRRSHSLDEWLQSKHAGNVRYYTWSIDDAVTLVPSEGFSIPWSWRVGNTPSGRGFAYVGTSLTEHDGASPAIALCLAALRARASSTDEQDADQKK